MIDIGYLYLVPLFIGLGYVVIQMLVNQTVKKERPFQNDYMNLFYNFSYVAPFKWFIEEDPLNEKVLSMNNLIKEAQMEQKIDYRSATTMQFSFLLSGVGAFAVVNAGLSVIIQLLAFMFNLNSSSLLENGQTMLLIRVVLFAACLVPAMGIKYYLKRKISQREVAFLKDLPLLQLFIILMLRSNATINETLYTLSTTDTAYREMFSRAYRIFLREPREAFDFLEENFFGTKIIETIYILRDYQNYAREESIRTLENNQEEILEFTASARKKAEAGKNLWASVSMAFPFLAVLMLAVGPLAYYAMNLFSNAGL